MPKKGRIHPCEDPLKKGHSRKSQFNDVRALGPVMCEEFQDKLPEYKWKEGLRLCGTCRARAFKKIQKREKYLGAAQTSASGNFDHLFSSPEMCDDEESTGLSQAGAHASGNLERQPVYPNLSDELQHVHVTPPCNLFPSIIPLPRETDGGGCSTPLSGMQGLGDSVFVSPVTPASVISRRTHDVPNFSTPTTSKQTSTFTSPSIAPTASSTGTGSLYNDEDTAKHDLHHLLHELGVSVPETSIKKQPRRLLGLMNEGIAAFKKKFMKYAGKDLEESPAAPCTCKFCEIIPAAVKAKLPTAETKREEYLVMSVLPPSVTIKDMENDYGVSKYFARKVSKLRATEGPLSCPKWKSTGTPLDDHVLSLVNAFYLSIDNSRVNTTARECVYVRNKKGKRKKRAKRMMMMNLKDAFQEFKRVNPNAKIGIAKFAQLRPKNCRWPGLKGFPADCTCIIHENFKMMLQGLKEASLEGIEDAFETDAAANSFLELYDDYKEFLNYLICDPASEECYLGYCQQCPNEIHFEKILSFAEGSNVTYQVWIKNEISTRTDSFEVFEESFRSNFMKFLTHEFIYQQQKNYIASLKNGDLDGGTTGVLTVDYGENYSFVVQDAVQGFHWINKQATIHPFVLYVRGPEVGKPLYKTYFVISNDMCHDSTAFHSFRVQVLKRIKEDYPHLKHIEYVSDGSGSQYKIFYNVANLLFHEDDFDLTARWNYTCTSHGKSTCDAMSAVVKRTIRLRSLSSRCPIVTPERMFEVARNELSSPTLEFLYVTREDNDYYRRSLAPRYARLKTIPGTQKWHYLAVEDVKRLVTKRFAKSAKQEVRDVLRPEDPIAEIAQDNTSDVDMETLELKVGEFYAMEMNKTYQIGQIIEVFEDRDFAKFLMMKKDENFLYWPLTDVYQEVEFSNIFYRVEPPKYDDETDYYKLQDSEVAAIIKQL